MTPKSVIGLGVVTLVAVVAAAFSLADQYGGSRQVRIEEPVVEGLEDRINDVARISVKSADDEFTVIRGENGWTVPKKGGYSANSELVRRTLFQLSQLRLIEPKTRLPERYPRLQVEDVDQEDAKSVLLNVSDDSGDQIAGLIVGKVKLDLAGAIGGGVYLRRPDEAQSWLAEGELVVRGRAIDWLPEQIAQIERDRIQSIEIEFSDETTVAYARPDAEQRTFDVVSGVPGDAKLKDNVLKDLPDVLQNLRLGDVARAPEKSLDDGQKVEAEVRMFDGLAVDVFLYPREDGIWGTFEARTFGDASDEAKAEAESLNARWVGWTYKLPEGKIGPLLNRPGDLMEG